MLDSLVQKQFDLIANYQSKAINVGNAQECYIWAQTIGELVNTYFRLANKDQITMALAPEELQIILTSIKEVGHNYDLRLEAEQKALSLQADLEAAIVSHKAEIEKLENDDQIEDADYEAKIADLTAKLTEDEAQLLAIKEAFNAKPVVEAAPVAETPVVDVTPVVEAAPVIEAPVVEAPVAEVTAE